MIPFLVLGGIGLVLAVAILVANRFLFVEEDKSVENVTKLLPGYNCGACGYPGCSGFAQAIIDGKVASLNNCKPGKEDINFKPILEFLKTEKPEIAVKLKIK